jgi:hypothetical protein
MSFRTTKRAAFHRSGDPGGPLSVVDVESDGHMPKLPGKERSAHQEAYIGRKGGGVAVCDTSAVRNVPADARHDQVAQRSAEP